MEQIRVIAFIWENREVFMTFIASLAAVLKLFAWGKSQSAALDAVTRAIERLEAVEVKHAVRESELVMPLAAKDALRDSVARVDPEKSPLSLIAKIVREIKRLIL